MLELAAAGRRARRGRRAPSEGPSGAGERSWLTPILVDYHTRDGSTLMMRLLASSPEIAVERPYPYEHKYFTYLWRWSRLVDRPNDPDRWQPGRLRSIVGEEETPMIGPPTWWPRPLAESAPGEAAMSRRVFDLAWEEFSRRAARRTRAEAGSDARVRYYAEKHFSSWRLDLAELPELRLVVLVRDPRDSFASMLAFDQARGDRGFGAQERELGAAIEVHRDRLRWIAGLARSGSPGLVRYEELVRDLDAVSSRLSDWLGVDLGPDEVRGDRSMRKLHATTKDAEASIGRWRGDLDPGLAAALSEGLGDELAALGFERS